MGNSLKRANGLRRGNSLLVNSVQRARRLGNSLMASGAVAWLVRHVF